MWLSKKTNSRRNQVRKNITADRLSRIGSIINTDVITSCLLWLAFVALCIIILSFGQNRYEETISTAVVVTLISLAAGVYMYHYQKKIIKNHARATALAGIFLLFLIVIKLSSLISVQTLSDKTSWATGTAVAIALILTIAYHQRFALGMGIFFCLFAFMAAKPAADMNLFLTMTAGVFTCCFSLKEIRTRMKLLEVSALVSTVVFITFIALEFAAGDKFQIAKVFRNAGLHALSALLVGLLIQSLLPLIEKIFRIATSMTLLDYSDANQPLLKKLAMEAPGTFSHSLLIGSIAEAAAESIGRNGLLCRVGAYYHDIGKMNKPTYFTENEIGSVNRHKELSPAMSQLIIIGHVKDGIEMAKEYNLPSVLRQFIETHHGTTLVEYFYNEAIKKCDDKQSPPSKSEFRYAGPKPKTKEAAIVMLADASESAVRSLAEVTPTKIEAVVHNLAMKRLQDGQFDESDLSLRELSRIETSISKTLAGHHHGRIAYPTPPDEPLGQSQTK